MHWGVGVRDEGCVGEREEMRGGVGQRKSGREYHNHYYCYYFEYNLNQLFSNPVAAI